MHPVLVRRLLDSIIPVVRLRSPRPESNLRALRCTALHCIRPLLFGRLFTPFFVWARACPPWGAGGKQRPRGCLYRQCTAQPSAHFPSRQPPTHSHHMRVLSAFPHHISTPQPSPVVRQLDEKHMQHPSTNHARASESTSVPDGLVRVGACKQPDVQHDAGTAPAVSRSAVGPCNAPTWAITYLSRRGNLTPSRLGCTGRTKAGGHIFRCRFGHVTLMHGIKKCAGSKHHFSTSRCQCGGRGTVTKAAGGGDVATERCVPTLGWTSSRGAPVTGGRLPASSH